MPFVSYVNSHKSKETAYAGFTGLTYWRDGNLAEEEFGLDMINLQGSNWQKVGRFFKGSGLEMQQYKMIWPGGSDNPPSQLELDTAMRFVADDEKHEGDAAWWQTAAVVCRRISCFFFCLILFTVAVI